MPAKIFLLILLWVSYMIISSPVMGQGFAGLGKGGEGYEEVSPNKVFTFPKDHGAHEGYRIEWWYVTANLTDEQGEAFGIQWTLFRSALAPSKPLSKPSSSNTGKSQNVKNQNNEITSTWSSPTIWMGHTAITSKNNHYSAERFARGQIGQAGVEAGDENNNFSAWIDDWNLTETLSKKTPLSTPLNTMHVSAKSDKFSYSLSLNAHKPIILQGEQGYSQKSDDGQASYYYSQPFFTANGAITIDGKTYQVSGKAWMDREWSSQLLSPDQEGWDWFSLHLDEDQKLMLFRLRDKDGSAFYSGAWIDSEGLLTPIDRSEIIFKELKRTHLQSRTIPTRWRLQIKNRNFDVTTLPLNKKSWMNTSFPYWEGPIKFKGTHNGVGYLEMTGY